MSEYVGQQFVGIDLHRRRSVIVRSTAEGEVLEAVRIVNDVDRLNCVIERAGEAPEVVLEATYGWYWAVDTLQDAGMVRGRLVRDPGYVALQQIPGIGPVLAAVFLAEIGDVSRFATAPQLACWTGLRPEHHESDTHVHRGRITKQASRLVRWAAVESIKRVSAHSKVGQLRDRVADGLRLLRAARRPCSCARAARETPQILWSVASRAGHDPHPAHPWWRGRAH